MSLKIYSYPDNYRVWKALVAAQFNQIDIELPAFDMNKGEHKTPEFLKMNPLGKVPVLVTPSGSLFESGAIARYVAGLRTDSNLLGASSWDSAKVNQWVDFCQNELEPVRGIILFPLLGYLQYNEKAAQEAKKELTNCLNVLNNHLLRNTFMVGNAVTLADISLVAALVDVFRLAFGPKFSNQFPNVLRWFNTCVNQPEFAKVMGKIEMAKEDAAPPKAAKAAKADKPAADKAKADKPKEAAAASAKPAAAPKGENDDLLDEMEAPKMKKANPLDALPESPMVLDAMKKLCFSQRPFLPDFFEQFWPQFDKEGYSWWLADYNYNSDNKEYWKIGNSLGGFIQRSDACRKYAMGSMQCSGPEDEEGTGPWILNGVWLFRGSSVPPEMASDNPDAEYYTWTKVDTDSEAGRAKIKEYYMGETINGAKVLDRRYFK